MSATSTPDSPHKCDDACPGQLAKVLNEVLDYDRDALEGALDALGGTRFAVDDLGVFNGRHPGVELEAIMSDGHIHHFRAVAKEGRGDGCM